ncbi:MAG: type II secretion system F family protein [Clostridia bacterium]|jgi:tight adherence protein C
MNDIVYLLGISLIFISLYYIVLSMAGMMREKRWRVISRLEYIKEYGGDKEGIEPLNLPFRERVIKPAMRKLGERIESLTPTRLQSSLKEKLIAAGYTTRTNMMNFLTIQGILVFCLPLLVMFLTSVLSSKPEKILLFGILAFLVSLLLPSIVLTNKKIARQNQIRKTLPDALDLLVVSVEAGLSFDMALVKVTEKIKGVLSEEFAVALNEIRLGKLRKQALREMAERTGVDELISFVGAVVQADQLGVSIGNVLRVQADSMRTYRRQKIEELTAKAPVKMLFPLIFFIFPSMFVVILGPAVIHLIRIFMGME